MRAIPIRCKPGFGCAAVDDFEDIANRPGLTSGTLKQFLRDSHNYPEAMNFTVEQERIRDLADYILTLRHPGYKPVM